MEKKSFGGPKEKKTSFFMPLEKLFFSFGHPKEAFFPFGTPKGKKLLKGGRAGANSFFDFGNFFSTWKKITQFLEFCKDQGGKI